MYLLTKFKIEILSLLLLGIFSCGTDKQNNFNKNLTSLNYNLFIDPPAEFRSHPFYAINDSLTEEEITRQILDFKQAGFGGFYLHSRSGLITGFLSDDWWKMMQASVDAANRAGLRCMFYDEDKWPSGYAGGIIPLMSEAYRAKCLARLAKETPLPPGAELIATDSATNYVLYTAQLGYDIFNGTCYVDLFNPEAVHAFIDVSYRPYAEKYRSQITNYRPAIFSDEPHVHARYFDRNTPNLGTLSYSTWLEKKFTELYAYNLRDKLELLYEEKDNWREVRMQYYRAKALLFEESYTRQIAAFCAANNMDYTGHYLAEDVLEKVRDRAANTMLHYRSMQQPGMDNLGLGFEGKLITARNLSSVANQFGKEKRLSELFGISGQNMNFEDRKWIAGWHSILGVNHFCPHLTLYSMKGHRKRDYPPSFSYQQPYWPFNKKLEDYLGRIAMAATLGKYAPQLLVINPLESEYIKGTEDGEFTSGMLTLLQSLQENHFDYDIGDEQILADTALVENGFLKVGEMSYQSILLPDMISIRQSTIDLIRELRKQGGSVFSTGRFPAYIDGKPDNDQLDELRKSIIILDSHFPGVELSTKVEPSIIVTGKNTQEIWSQTRVIEGGKLVQLFNVSHTASQQFQLKTEFPGGDVVLWDPSLAKCFPIKPGSNGFFAIEIPPSSNIWITSGTFSEKAEYSSGFKQAGETKVITELKKPWSGKRLSPNALTLDFARYSLNGTSFSKPEPVIGIFSRLAEANYSGKLVLAYDFDIKTVPANCALVLEQPEQFSTVRINADNYEFTDEGFYIDHSFRKSDITNQIKAGRNTIWVELEFKVPQALSADPKTRYGTEIESIYLIGDFAVEGFSEKEQYETYDTQRNNSGNFQKRPVRKFTGFSLSKEKSSFSGELVFEGYPFYAGAFELSQTVYIDSVAKNTDYFLELPNCESIASIVAINGEVTDTLVWAPFRTNITGYLKAGENTVTITLVNSLRNLLGPHHHNEGELIRVGPNSFTGAGGFPDGRGDSKCYDQRINGANNPIWTDTYMHIPFGFLEPVKITATKK